MQFTPIASTTVLLLLANVEGCGFNMIIDFQVTSNCNMNCKYCFDILKEVQEKSIADALASLDILVQAGITGIVITGGEPLLYHGVKELCHRAKELGLYVYLSTNGSFFNETHFEMLGLLDCIGLPIDSTDNHLHRILGRPENQLNITFDCIASIRKVNSKAQIKIGTVVTALNYNDLESLGNMLQYVLSDRDVWRLYEFNPIGNGERNRDFLLLEHAKFTEAIKNLKNKYTFNISPMSISDSICGYIFVSPDMHLLAYDSATFKDYGALESLGVSETRKILLRDMFDISEKSRKNRGWINEDL